MSVFPRNKGLNNSPDSFCFSHCGFSVLHTNFSFFSSGINGEIDSIMVAMGFASPPLIS